MIGTTYTSMYTKFEINICILHWQQIVRHLALFCVIFVCVISVLPEKIEEKKLIHFMYKAKKGIFHIKVFFVNPL